MRCGPFGTPKEVLMKRWMVVALVAALAAVLVPVALAGGDTPGVEDHLGGAPSEFLAEGHLTWVGDDDADPYVNVWVTQGTRAVKDVVDSEYPEITAKLATNCAIVECVDGGELRTYDELQAFWEADPTRVVRVRIRGSIELDDAGEAVYVITRLQVHALIPTDTL
jgi:hypothetical protein